jgi:acetyltransferase-like isoleucine patch superfamily enzyme
VAHHLFADHLFVRRHARFLQQRQRAD